MTPYIISKQWSDLAQSLLYFLDIANTYLHTVRNWLIIITTGSFRGMEILFLYDFIAYDPVIADWVGELSTTATTTSDIRL